MTRFPLWMWTAICFLALLCCLEAAPQARAQVVVWKGITWTNLYASNTIGVNPSTGNLEVSTGDSTVANFGGATHAFPSTLRSAPEVWAQARFIDTGVTPGPQINVLFFDTSTSVFLAALGASDNQGRYIAHWRRESPLSTVVSSNSVDVGPRSPGQHSARIGRRADGRLEFWLDGVLRHSTAANTFPSNFNFVYLVDKGTQPGQIAIFTDYQEGSAQGQGQAQDRQAFVRTCLGRSSCEIGSDERSVFSGVASITASYGRPALQAQMSVDAFADASFGVLRSRVSDAFEISGSAARAYVEAGASFSETITVNFPPFNGQPGLMFVQYTLNGNISAINPARGLAGVDFFVADRPLGSQHFVTFYSSPVAGLFLLPKAIPFIYGQPFTFYFTLRTLSGTFSPTFDIIDGVAVPVTVTELGRGAATADFFNTLVLSGLEVFDSNGNPLPSPPTITSASGTQYSENGVLKSFARLFVRDVDLEEREKEFEIGGSFTLGAGSNGINPLTEDVALQIGTFSTVIPAGSFKQDKEAGQHKDREHGKEGEQDKEGRFKFEGVINGAALEVVIQPLGGDRFKFRAKGHGADLTGTVNPVKVRLIIGDDGGSTTSTAEFE